MKPETTQSEPNSRFHYEISAIITLVGYAGIMITFILSIFLKLFTR